MYEMILVDDEPWVLEGLEQIINWEDYGFHICGRCSSARQALREIQEKRLDAVCTDIRMPNLSGMDLISQVRGQKGLDVEFVIISAFSDFEVARKAIAYGAVGYILKPLAVDEVVETVLRLKGRLDGKRGRTALAVDLGDPAVMREAASCLPGCPGPEHSCFVLMAEAGAGLPRDWQGLSLDIAGQRYPAWFCIAPARGPGLPNPAGCSLPRPDGTDLGEMVREAVASFRGGFRYAGHPVVAKIQFYLGEHYGQALSLSHLASRFYLSENYLCDLFKKNTGDTILNFLKKLRLAIACRLLRETDRSIKEIAGMVGFNDYSYFGRVFRRELRQTPDQYRCVFAGREGDKKE